MTCYAFERVKTHNSFTLMSTNGTCVNNVHSFINHKRPPTRGIYANQIREIKTHSGLLIGNRTHTRRDIFLHLCSFCLFFQSIFHGTFLVQIEEDDTLFFRLRGWSGFIIFLLKLHLYSTSTLTRKHAHCKYFSEVLINSSINTLVCTSSLTTETNVYV